MLGLARGTNGRYSSVQGPICLHLGMPLCHFISGDVSVLDRESAECEMAEVGFRAKTSVLELVDSLINILIDRLNRS